MKSRTNGFNVDHWRTGKDGLNQEIYNQPTFLFKENKSNYVFFLSMFAAYIPCQEVQKSNSSSDWNDVIFYLYIYFAA